jgi:hypothetical protein
MGIENALLEHAAALNNLADAIRSTAGTPAESTVKEEVKAEPKTKSKATTTESKDPIWWADSETGHYGICATEAEFKKDKKSAPGMYKIPESMYDDRVKAAKAKQEEIAAKAKADKAEQAEQAEEAGASSDDSAPTMEDLIDSFRKYLPGDLDAAERKARHAWVKPLLARFGAAKATDMDEQHWALAIHLVERKITGEEVDPETATWAGAAVEEEADVF